MVGGDERDQARTAVFTREGEVNVFRFQKILVAAELVRQCMSGDAGDADFEEEVGGCSGPGGSIFEQRCDVVENGRGWSVVEGFDDVRGAFFDHACGEERRIDHVVGLRRRILDVKVGHDSHLRADNGRISFPINPDKQTISEPAGTSRKCHKPTSRLNVKMRLGRSHNSMRSPLGVHVAGTPRRSAKVIGTVWAQRA